MKYILLLLLLTCSCVSVDIQPALNSIESRTTIGNDSLDTIRKLIEFSNLSEGDKKVILSKVETERDKFNALGKALKEFLVKLR